MLKHTYIQHTLSLSPTEPFTARPVIAFCSNRHFDRRQCPLHTDGVSRAAMFDEQCASRSHREVSRQARATHCARPRGGGGRGEGFTATCVCLLQQHQGKDLTTVCFYLSVSASHFQSRREGSLTQTNENFLAFNLGACWFGGKQTGLHRSLISHNITNS